MSQLLYHNLADIFMLWQVALFGFGLVYRRLMQISIVLGIISVVFRLMWFCGR